MDSLGGGGWPNGHFVTIVNVITKGGGVAKIPKNFTTWFMDDLIH